MANNKNEACSNTRSTNDNSSNRPSVEKESVKKEKAPARKLIEKSLLEIKRLKKQVADFQEQSHGSIAIVGASCRLPGGVKNLDDLWNVLEQGEDCISYEGNDRWPWKDIFDSNQDAPGKIYTKAMGLIDEPIKFDADFFGISPREANEIDPQQRLLLEASYLAIENAGYSLQSIKGSKTGVFMGVSSQDYSQLGSRFGELENITPWQGTGVSPSASAGRLSYWYDFTGPSLAIDTACSSSLVALHYACQSLRQGECNAALVGGVNVILNPGTSILFAKAKMLSPDGACKTFDQDANGYVRSEGCSVVMVKRLKDAIANGDHIHAVIRGTAVNQDGRSQGLTAPNELSQQKVINAALQQAQCEPEDISYVEAHGTGTPLGDPIELNALQAVYGKNRNANSPLKVGSCKSNFGHAEAAAGLFGLLKLVVSLQHKKIPASLHFKTPNPYVDWSQMNVNVVDTLQDWSNAPLRAGLSGFGFTGTNAHVIVEAYDVEAYGNGSVSSVAEEQRSDQGSDQLESRWQPEIFALSAKNATSLADANTLLGEYLAEDERSLPRVSYSLAVGRDHYHFRQASSVGGDVSYFGKKTKPTVSTLFSFSDDIGKNRSEVALNIKNLKQQLPAFSSEWRKIDTALEGSVKGEQSELLLEAVDSFGVQFGLAKNLMAWGIKPKTLATSSRSDVTREKDKNRTTTDSQVMGTIASELSAATIAGILSLTDALSLLCQLTSICLDVNNVVDNQLVDSITLQRPRLQFCSKLMTDNNGFMAFGKDSSIAQSWLDKLTKIAQRKEVEMAGVDGGESGGKSCDIHITLNEHMDVIINDSIDVTEKKNSVLYARPVQGRTPFPSSCSIFQQLETLLLKSYVAGLDIDWHSVFINHGQGKTQLPGYSFQRKEFWNSAIPKDLSKQGEQGEQSQNIEGTDAAVKTKAPNNPSGATQCEPLENWAYQYERESIELVRNEMSLPQHWLVISDSEQNANGLYSQLISRGHLCTAVTYQADDDGIKLQGVWDETTYQVINTAKSLQQWLETIIDNSSSSVSKPMLNLVLSVEGETQVGESEKFKAQYDQITTLTLWLAQALPQIPDTSLWTVTANGMVDGKAIKTKDGDPSFESCASTLLTGFSKALSLELSGVMRGNLDYPSSFFGLNKAVASALVDALMSELPSANLHFNGQQWFQPILKHRSLEARPEPFAALRSDAFYVIAGGTGSIGLSVAQRLLNHGAKKLVLLSRSGVNEGSTNYSTISGMRKSADILTPALDICDREALDTLLNDLRSTHPIAGVIHTAGLFDISPLPSLTKDACTALMDNKVLGLRWLDELTMVDNLDLFVGFSSIASVWGSAGNFHYTAANYCVDAVIQHRVSIGLPGVVINWGPWSASNMVTDESEEQANKRGIYAMKQHQALDWFERLVLCEGNSNGDGNHQAIVADIRWSQLKPLLELTKVGALVSHLSDVKNDSVNATELAEGEGHSNASHVELNSDDIAFKQELEGLSKEDREPAMLAYVTQQLANALESEVQDIDVFQPLLNLGIDSLMAVEFKNRVTKVTGVEIPLVRLLEGSHLCDLSKMLCDEYAILLAENGLQEDDEELFFEGAL